MKSNDLENLVVRFAKEHPLEVIYSFLCKYFKNVKKSKRKVTVYFNGYSFEFTKRTLKIYFDVCKRRVYLGNSILSYMYILYKKLYNLWYNQEIKEGKKNKLKKRDRFVISISYSSLDKLEEVVDLILYFDKLKETYKIKGMMEDVLESFLRG